MVGEKIRFRFEKAGDLRLLSHLDLMRACERMLRRARIPFRSTLGFHPTPRLVFALSLPLGVIGRNEVVELELLEPLDSDDLLARLNEQSPRGLTFKTARVVDPKASALPRRVVYRLPVAADRLPFVRSTIDEVLSREKLWTDRLRPRPRRVNVRPYIRSLRVEGGGLVLDLWVTQSGTARADELLRVLGVADIPDDGAVVERTDLELIDEAPADAHDGPPTGPPETAPLEIAPADKASYPETTIPTPWGVSPGGPVVE